MLRWHGPGVRGVTGQKLDAALGEVSLCLFDVGNPEHRRAYTVAEPMEMPLQRSLPDRRDELDDGVSNPQTHGAGHYRGPGLFVNNRRA